jgi:hypothetical protein
VMAILIRFYRRVTVDLDSIRFQRAIASQSRHFSYRFLVTTNCSLR